MMSIQEQASMSPLMVTQGGGVDASDSNDDAASTTVDFDERILSIIQDCRDDRKDPTQQQQQQQAITIRPARLSSQLGISMEDATAELCALMRAIGPTATFTFDALDIHNGKNDNAKNNDNDTTTTTTTMTFHFPPDFKNKLRSSRRRDDTKVVLMNIGYQLFKIIKIITAFGLILSLAIVLIGAMCATIAFIIVMARGGVGNGRHQQRMMHSVRSMFLSLRQLMWCYVMFGRIGDDNNGAGQDPFLQEIARDILLWSNLVWSAPGSIWFWFTVGRLRDRQERRRRRGGQGTTRWWRQDNHMTTTTSGPMNQSNSWGQDRNEAPITDQRGFLSVAVEFLFGPTPFWPGPSEYEKWKMRELVLWDLYDRICTDRSGSAAGGGGDVGIPMVELLPYTDRPVRSKEEGNEAGSDSASGGKMHLSWHNASECLNIVTHFNGVPVAEASSSPIAMKRPHESSSMARFVFPELVSEGRNDFHFGESIFSNTPSDSPSSWISVLFDSQQGHSFSFGGGRTLGGGNTANTAHKKDQSTMIVPTYLHEKTHVLTQLSPRQFALCCIINSINFVGIWILRASINSNGGTLEIRHMPTLKFLNGICSMLLFYSKLFFALPLIRLVLILVWNHLITSRNIIRKEFAERMRSLASLKTELTDE